MQMCYAIKISVKLDDSQPLLEELLVDNFQLVIQIRQFTNSCIKSIFILINNTFK